MLTKYLKSIADKIREKIGTTDKINAQDFNNKIDEVYEAGRINATDEFWYNYQKTKGYYGYPNSYYMFAGICWNDKTFYPKYDIVGYGATQNVFAYNGCTNLKQRLEECGVKFIGYGSTGITNLNSCFQYCATEELPPIYNVKPSKDFELTGTFQYCTKLKTVPYYDFFSKVVKYQATFNGCSDLETVEGIDFSSATTTKNVFLKCTSLKNITIYGNIPVSLSFLQSAQLTEESLKSIINHLYDYSTEDPGVHTLTLHADSKTLLESLTDTHESGSTWVQRIADLGWNLV